MIKQFEQYNEYSWIKRWLISKGVENYIINDDLTVDVDGNVDISDLNLTDIMVQFGRVTGTFTCTKNKLKSLKGCPKYVGKNFWCERNRLTSLEGCPEYIEDSFYCTNNYITTLKYAPKVVNGTFDCANNNLPDVISYFKNNKILLKYQEEYSIWNNDGSFNKERFNIFLQDYNDGILT